MCFDDDARPPIPPMAGAALDATRLHLTSADGTRFAAFAASTSPTPTEAAMIVLPDVRGLHRYYEELAMRFAEAGIDALAIDYFGRTAPDDVRGPEFEHMPHVARTTWSGLQADIAAAADHLRAQGPRRLFTVGFCFGGRIALLTPTVPELDVAGAIGFYGWPTGRSRNDTPAPADVADANRAPVLAPLRGRGRGHHGRRGGDLRGGPDRGWCSSRDRHLPRRATLLLRPATDRLRRRVRRRLATDPRLRTDPRGVI